MEPTFQSFLLFLRKLASFFRKRWDRSARKLWYIFGFLGSRFSSPKPTKRDETPRSIGSRPENPPTAVICASSVPPQLTPIAGGDTPIITSPTITSPTPTFSFRKPTILDYEGPLHEAQGNHSSDHLDVNSYHLEGSRAISRSHNSASHYGEHEYTHNAMAQNQEDLTSNPPVMPSRPISRPHSQYSRPQSQRPPSVNSFRSPSYLNGAEMAARGYLNAPPSPNPSSLVPSRPPSTTGSFTSQAYRTPRLPTRVPRPSSMRNASQRRGRSSTPTSVRPSVHEAHPEVPTFPQSASRTSMSIRHDLHSTAASVGPPPSPKTTLRPMIEIDRYGKHKSVIVGKEVNQHDLLPVTTKFLRNSAPESWIPLMHPEGALYWVIHEDVSRNRIYTDTDMCDPDLRQQIEEAIKEINELRVEHPPLPAGWELVLELGPDKETGEPTCRYYFVCNTTRCLFWLHKLDLKDLLGGLPGVTERTHIHVALQLQYWTHWEMFPHNRDVPEPLVQELTGILIHAGIDCMTSTNSTATYPEEDLGKLLRYVKHIRSVGGDYGFSACIVGRLMSFFSCSRYVNFYGQKGARLANDQTIYGSQPKRTYLIKILSIFFFYAPELHLRGLESVYTDFVICQHRWQRFITRLQDDWREFILYGTVLLNANVAFLAIPSVDSGNQNRTPVQLASYLSIITSIGSVVVGLLLLRQHRTKPQDAADEVERYLRSRHHDALGFETLAILYSLPYSLLLWATIAFTTAFGLEALLFSSGLWAKLPVGITLALAALLIFWCVGTALEAKADISILGEAHFFKRSLAKFTGGLRGKIFGPRLNTGDAGDDDQDMGRTPNQRWRLGWPRASTASTLVSQTGSNGTCGPPDGTGVEMGDMNDEEIGSAV